MSNQESEKMMTKLEFFPVKDNYLKKYEELTPMGSEFADNPRRVYEYIKERLQSAGEAKKENVRLRRELAGQDKVELDINERVAQITAHRACCGTEHDPAHGKFHGCCIVCGVPFPCEYIVKNY